MVGIIFPNTDHEYKGKKFECVFFDSSDIRLNCVYIEN